MRNPYCTKEWLRTINVFFLGGEKKKQNEGCVLTRAGRVARADGLVRRRFARGHSARRRSRGQHVAQRRSNEEHAFTGVPTQVGVRRDLEAAAGHLAARLA